MSIYSETNKSYYQKNREKLLAKRKKYYQDNPKKCLLSRKKYYLKIKRKF
jgi:hypothetical protein